MHIGVQLETPDGLGSLAAGLRYHYAGRSEMHGILLVWFHPTETTRWRAAAIHIDEKLLEKELTESPPGIRKCNKQFNLPPSICDLEGLSLEPDTSLSDRKGGTGKDYVQARLTAITFLLEKEEQILTADRPLKEIARLSKLACSKTHQWDLQYWFFAYILHGRSRWALRPATHQNGTWSRADSAHLNTKFGRPAGEGRRKGWSSLPLRSRIIKSYLDKCGTGIGMAEIYRKALSGEFGCLVRPDGCDGREVFHPKNEPFPSYGQFRYCVEQEFGLSAVQTTRNGKVRARRGALVDGGNTTGRLANFLEAVEVDAYRCNARPLSYRHETMPELVVARAICVTTGARVGIGFSLGGETKEAYRAMLWSMAVDKKQVAEAYGIPANHLDWPMIGMCRSLLSDRGPAGQEALIEDLEKSFPIKSITPSYTPEAKPNVESSNPRSIDPEGAPTFVQSELHVAGLMKQEVLRAASENRSVSIVERLSPEAIDDFHRFAIPATPQALWRYLDERLRSNALNMTWEDATRTFLRASTVTVDKVGIVFNGLHFNSPHFRDSGLHEKLVRLGIKQLKAYSLSLVGRVLWVQADDRLHELGAMRRIRFDLEELDVPVSELEELARKKKVLRARTAESCQAAGVELESVVKVLTGEALNSGPRKSAKPGRGKKGQARQESAVLKATSMRKAA